jgi:double-stranded uracil-DNA glycosylase
MGAVPGRSTQSLGLTRTAVPSQGFAPIADERAKVLVLGTLPGVASLNAGEYYANSQNGFWRIMGALFKWPLGLPYQERANRLVSAGVALWDVCEAAHRPGSLDTAIDTGSVTANDFEAFFREHPSVRLICFNGAKAASLYGRKVHRKLPEPMKSIQSETLPSTSPANASVPYSDKLLRWAIVRKVCET